MRARHYLELIGDVIVAKHGIGPDRQPDNSEKYPVVPSDWVPISFEQYLDAQAGDTYSVVDGIKKAPRATKSRRIEERLARIEARIKQLENRGR